MVNGSIVGQNVEQSLPATSEPIGAFRLSQHKRKGSVHELFAEEQAKADSDLQQPWWKNNFLLTDQSMLFGTYDGVFTSCMINIFGVVIFLRTGWMVGNVGIELSVLIIFITISVALIAVLSAIGVCERCQIDAGGVYFLLSHVLGAKLGAAIGILYCLGQAVGCSLYIMGFGESITALIVSHPNDWIARGIAVIVLVFLVGINLAGVKWVIRLQLILLIILLMAVLDFMIGSFVTRNPAHGVVGYSRAAWHNNTGQSYLPNQNFFTVFGVFFPTATGVFAGINMSGELKDPKRSIPAGTLSAIGVSTILYLCFALVLAATCERSFLQTDYMIASKVSLWAPLLLTGLYISSLSASLGSVTGSPRVLQVIAETTELPLLHWLRRSWGNNEVPVMALLMLVMVTLLFVLVGNVNVLGPIVTMPFMLTYAAVDYAYFALAMSFDMRRRRQERLSQSKAVPQKALYDYTQLSGRETYRMSGSALEGDKSLYQSGFPANDLDHLFPTERADVHGDPVLPARYMLLKGDMNGSTLNAEIYSQPRSCYSVLSNRWVSLFGVVTCFVIMFMISWVYSIAIIVLALILYVYIGRANPGVFPGIAEFQLWKWLSELPRKVCCRLCLGPPSEEEEILITPHTPALNTQASQLTEENTDFAARDRYHQTRTLH